jgi:hypothetical protein
MGWQLGAIEGVGVTTLVGLSVDFCIHFSEAFVMSPLHLRKDKARCALATLRCCIACCVSVLHVSAASRS